VIYAQERGEPEDREKIDWKLITDLPVQSRQDAIEKLQWYALRWNIETFHKNLKSGCKAEESKLGTAERLVNLVSIFCILAWRNYWMTMINRSTSKAPPKLVLTDNEIEILDRVVKDKNSELTTKKNSLLVFDQDRKARRLSWSLERSASRQHRHVAWAFTPDRY
jgi:hypothetical protein